MKSFARQLYFVASLFAVLVVFLLAPPLRWLRSRLGHRFCSLWAGTPILTLPLNARAESLLGVDAKSLVYGTYGIARGSFDINLSSWVQIPLFGRLVPFLVFMYACVFKDRLHFFCDQALLPARRRFLINRFELMTYKYLGIQLFFWVYGADIRIREITLQLGYPNCCSFCPAVGKACVCDNSKGAESYRAIKQYATGIFSMGDMIHYTPGSRNDVFFWPIDLTVNNGEKYAPVFPEAYKDAPVRIVHAANHRAFKGTDFLVAAVAELQRKHVAVELVLVENLPNELALVQYRSADIVFDQCLIGFHGYFALEGMALGKPVMSFVRFPAQYLLSPDDCPIVKTSLSTLERDIEKLCHDRLRLRELGMLGRQYIENYYTIEAVSKRMAVAYQAMGV